MKSNRTEKLLFCSWRAIGMALACLPALTLQAQLPVLEGKSTARSGMVYYDQHFAEDQLHRIYKYTLAPDSAACMTLEFNLVESQQDGDDIVLHDKRQDFIWIYEGADERGPLVAALGKSPGNRFYQSKSKVLTIVFQRDAVGLHSTWTAQWKGKLAAACIDPYGKGPCAEVQDICGPSFHENFHYYRQPSGATGLLETPGTCIPYQRNSVWYRFMAQKDGPLTFAIRPDNGFDDFDWVLLKGNPKDPTACPDLKKVEQNLACNYAQGRGPGGSTGMGEWGEQVTGDVDQSPYSAVVQAKKGEVYYLLVDDYSQHSQGFTIDFNDVVYACENPKKALLPLDQLDPAKRPAIDPRKSFNQYTRVLRIDLDEKANLPLAHAQLPATLFPMKKNPYFERVDHAVTMSLDKGLVAVLLNGLKSAKLEAVSAVDLKQPVHFGDLLEMARRLQGGSSTIGGTWWNPSPDLLERFTNVVELIVDETVDPSGKAQRKIRYVRLLWTDRDGKEPDYAVAVFDYWALSGYLDQVTVYNPHNDVQQLSLKDFLEHKLYQAVEVTRSGKDLKNLKESRFMGDRQVELDNFIWGE